MAYIVEPSGEDKLTLLITSREGFMVTVHTDGTIAITGPKDAFLGIGELLVEPGHIKSFKVTMDVGEI